VDDSRNTKTAVLPSANASKLILWPETRISLVRHGTICLVRPNGTAEEYSVRDLKIDVRKQQDNPTDDISSGIRLKPEQVSNHVNGNIVVARC
jgi:hypothetical protein